MKPQKRIKYLLNLLMVGAVTLFVGCDFFDSSASLTVSVDADKLQKFIDENVSSNVTKGNFAANADDLLSLRVVLTGDESGEYTANVPNASSYRSTVSVNIKGLRVGAKIKVRVDLMRGSEIIISGGTKKFAVSAGGNNVAVPMGNYSDIIVWDLAGNYCRGGIEAGERFNSFSLSNSGIKNMAFDSANSSLHFVYGNSYYYNTSWRQYNSFASTSISSYQPVIAAYNGSLYYCNGSSSTNVFINCRTSQGMVNRESLFSSTQPISVTALALSPDGTKAYAAYTVEIGSTSNNYEYYISSFDVSVNSWRPSSTVEVARSGDFLGSDINYRVSGKDEFLTNGFKVTDIKVQDGYVWVLVREGQGDDLFYGISRGALIRYNTSLGDKKVFGWTADNQTAQASNDPDDFDHYRVPPSPNSNNFFGPLKFIASRPGELVIADDGYFRGWYVSSLESIPINRIVFFDTNKESVSNVHSLSGYDFDYDFSRDFKAIGALTAPTGVSITGLRGSSTGRIEVSWNAVRGAESYDVYCDENNSIPSSPKQNETGTSATITGLTNNKTYHVWVKAKTGSVESEASAMVKDIVNAEFIDVEGVRFVLRYAPSGVVTSNIGVTKGPFANASDVNVSVAGFMIGETEVTYELWYAVRVWAVANKGYTFANLGKEGSSGTTDGAEPTSASREPVTKISWLDAIIWCNALSEATGRSAVYRDGSNIIKNSTADLGDTFIISANTGNNGYRLPTEAEWEYAARGGVPSTGEPWTYTYAGSNREEDVVVYSSKTEPVKSKKGGAYNGANSLGLYDMSGNVWEWCWDLGHKDELNRIYRVIRGGSYYERVVVGARNYWTQFSTFVVHWGFRIVRAP